MNEYEQFELFPTEEATKQAESISNQASNISLINDDCAKALKGLASDSVDLVIMDPPYEFDGGGGGGAFGSKKRDYHAEYIALYRDDPNISAKERERKRINACRRRTTNNLRMISAGFDFSILDEIERIQKAWNIYVWCSKAQVGKLLNYFTDKGCHIDILTWHKTNPIPTCNGTYLNDTEYCVFARSKGVKVYGSYTTKRKWYVSKANVEDKKIYEHPTIKPLDIIKNLVINSSQEGETVLDCFMGSGTTGVASKLLGRNFIGIEIDEHYFEIAKKRIEET